LELFDLRLQLRHFFLHALGSKRLLTAQRKHGGANQQCQQDDAQAVIGNYQVDIPQNAVHQVGAPDQQAGPADEAGDVTEDAVGWETGKRVEPQFILVTIHQFGGHGHVAGELAEQMNLHRAVVQEILVNDRLARLQLEFLGRKTNRDVIEVQPV